MAKGRKTSYEERVQIVTYCIEHGMDYAQAAEKYQVSYQQIYQWTRKYQSNGAEGLIDKRGKRKPETEMSEKRRAQLEAAFLKKLDEIERRRF